MNPLTGPRLTQLLTILRQPQWIAAILSVGFHGVLFAAGPSFSSLSMASSEGNGSELEERRVPLIELTPAEQDRLPDFSSSPYSLSSSGDDNLFSLFPPSGNSLPLNPGSDFGSSLSIPTPNLSSNPFSAGISPYTFPRRSSIVIPSRRATLPPPPSARDLERRPETPEDSASSPASTPTSTTPETGTSTAATDLGPENGAPETAPENGTAGTTPGSAPNSPGQPSMAERTDELLARVEYSEAQTTAADVEIAKAAWLQTVQEKLGDNVAQAPEPIKIQVPYSGRLCLNPAPTEGLLGVIGLPDDQTSSGLKLWTTVLKSTGYPFLNQAAEQALRGLEQQAREEDGEGGLEPNTLYQVVVNVEYDSETCVSRDALLQSRTAEEPDAPAPSPE